MGNFREVMSVVAGQAVVVIVSGVVWGMLAVGLYQLARDGIRRAIPRLRTARLTKIGGSRQAG